MFKSTRTNNKNIENAVSALGALQREMLVYGHQNYQGCSTLYTESDLQHVLTK